MVRELEDLLARVREAMPGLATAVRRFPGGAGGLERRAFVTPADHPLSRAVASACEVVTGGAPEFGSFPAWTDGGWLVAPGGIPTLILGPGDLALAHSPREAVPVSEVLEATRIYLATARRFCAGEGLPR
jgi:acetylornithine deacetylase/succinyl-diaminopimelate desuccinylase-like protein